MELEEQDVVLCEVDRIVGTTVFVKILSDKKTEGSIIFSELAPGRIRNIRNYVVPKKKIVCKVLKAGKTPELSLRRVTQDEKKRVLEKYKHKKSYENMLKSILGKEKSEKILEKILGKKESIYSFFEEARKNPKKLEKILGKKDSGKIQEILESQKPKKSSVKKEIELKSQNPKGLEEIKKILSSKNSKNIEIRYISDGRYSLETESEDLKKADNFLKKFLKEVEKKAKKSNMIFSILQK